MSQLTLVSTPIASQIPLNPLTHNRLEEAWKNQAIIVCEEPKASRRRWIDWGLPREAIDDFRYYNEHNFEESSFELLNEIQKGKEVYLLSDCGLPAFCDPGRKLVELCHDHKLKVTATPFDNSISLALSLSGFHSQNFRFQGFLPRNKDKRKEVIEKLFKVNETTLVMDAPYRLPKVLEELQEFDDGKERFFLATELLKPQEKIMRGKLKELKKNFSEDKREFILVVKCLN